MLSIQRQITASMLLTMSYVGNQGHHLLELSPANPGNAALCLSLSHRAKWLPEAPRAARLAKTSMYTSSIGHSCTRGQATLACGGAELRRKRSVTAQKTIGNSNYNALETNLRYAGKRSDFLLGYTYAKSIDQGSNIGEQLNPFNPALTPRYFRPGTCGTTSWPATRYDLPFDRLSARTDRLTEGWSISGTTRFSTGFPVTLVR